MPEIRHAICNEENKMLEKKDMRVGFIEVVATEQEGGSVDLVITSHGRGKIKRAKLGHLPLPLKLAIKEGTKLSLTLAQE
jgi:hypothetical protein